MKQRFRISDQQRTLLAAFLTADGGHPARSGGWLTDTVFYAALWGKTWPRKRRQIPPLTPSQRASLSRSVRRLVEHGLVAPSGGATYMITDKGIAVIR